MIDFIRFTSTTRKDSEVELIVNTDIIDQVGLTDKGSSILLKCGTEITVTETPARVFDTLLGIRKSPLTRTTGQ